MHVPLVAWLPFFSYMFSYVCILLQNTLFPFEFLFQLNMITSISLPASTINCNKLISSSLHITPQLTTAFNGFSVQKNPHKACHGSCYSPRTFSLQPLIQISSSSRQRGSSLVVFDGKSSGSGEEDREALHTVLKLYSAIKNKNIHELSDIIGDECRCVCNFFPFFQPFQGKAQVVDFFSRLIRSLGKNIEFVVKPTLHDGMHVGVAWRLEWNKKNVPLGKGFSFYICQIYQGKVYIRNVEMFMEPLLHMEPFRLKILGYIMTLMDKLGSYHTVSKNTMKRGLYILFTLSFISVIFFFSKPGLY